MARPACLPLLLLLAGHHAVQAVQAARQNPHHTTAVLPSVGWLEDGKQFPDNKATVVIINIVATCSLE